ncbi:ARF GTPase-activating protein GIT2 [Planococcus citri]|uniref:ARF GTPase-activating protein GIT2 n=1 Tax=Planococcus citri TaxID=170843 RepID=UPI0031F9532D
MLDKFKTVCADCGHNDVTWAVVNRGLLICDECCSVHRSLGRHISQLKSLTKGHWRSSLLNMVQTLSNGSINSLWEHTLSESKSSKKKPQPGDPVHPNKADFIRAKHQDLTYILKSRNSDSPEDLNQQLHSSVRTSNLETSLRLLIQGADPNYYHVEKGNNVIHVAAGAGQMEQIELLVNYGADPNVIDSHGNTPAACARVNGFLDIEEKIIECMYEVTDTFCMFLCKRKSDHKTEHFFVPEISECCMPIISNKQIKLKLQELSNVLFEEITMDVFDEVDRRENESISQLSKLKDQTLVPFLPVNPELSTMRNQGRQKLARLSKEEFATLVWDILCECKRRQNPPGEGLLNKIKANIADEEPLYDSVASDDDYAIAEEMFDQSKDLVAKDASTPAQSPEEENSSKNNILEGDLKSRLITSEIRISELVSQVVELQQKMDDIKKENVELRNTMHHRQESTSETDSVVEVKPRPSSLYSVAQKYINSSNSAIDRTNSPDPEEILRKADQVTKRLQELSKTIRSIEHHGGFTPCVENVRSAIADLTAIFPQGSTEETIRSALRTLNTNTIRLQAVCADVDATVEKIRNYAFNMAKANRQILTHFQC